MLLASAVAEAVVLRTTRAVATTGVPAALGGKLLLDGGTISLQSEGNPIEFRKIEILRK